MRLNAQEHADFERDGYFLVRQALAPSQVDDLRAIAESHDHAFRQQAGITKFHVLNEHDLTVREPEWLELIDLPSTFPKVVDIMGWNIQLFHTQLLVTPPSPESATPGPYGWHQDNNRMNRDLDTGLHPMISLKVGYFLSSLPSPGMGNLAVLPGSHLTPFVGSDPSPASLVDAIEIVAEAGDAVVFDRRLWHSASANLSDTTRVFVTYGYSYRWLRPKSKMPTSDEIAELSPVRRQLLGWATSANGYFDPLPEDVPLREWIVESS